MIVEWRHLTQFNGLFSLINANLIALSLCVLQHLDGTPSFWCTQGFADLGAHRDLGT